MITLRILRGPDAGKVLTSESDLLVIGRGADCTVVLNDRAVSRRHCSIERRGEGFVLTDLQSANGTFITDLKTRITTYTLQNGDEIVLGDSCVLVELLARAEGDRTAVGEVDEDRTFIQAPSLQSDSSSDPTITLAADEELTAIRQPDVPIVVTVVNGPDLVDHGQVYAPAGEVFSIGRADTCAIVLHDPKVSGTHATIKRQGGKYRIYDENSRNGTFLRTPQGRIFHADLIDGDLIYLGETQLRVAIRLGARAASSPEDETIVSGMVEGKDFTFTLAALPPRGAKGSQRGETLQLGTAADPSSEPEEDSPTILASQALTPRIIFRVVEGKDVGATFEPQPGTRRFTVGRSRAADWVIRDDRISRIHFAVEATPNGFLLIDEDSLNGTFIDQNTERVRRVELRGGEEIRLSQTRLQVEIIAPEDVTVLAPLPSPPKAETEKPPAAPTPPTKEAPSGALPADAPEQPQVENVRSRSAAFKERLAKISKQKGVSLRPVTMPGSPRQWAVLILMLIVVASSYGFVLLGRQSLFSAGPVSESHAQWGQQCATCHPAWNSHQMNATCVTAGCHHTNALKVSETVNDDCVSCHTEHRGRRFDITGGEGLCWSCHEAGRQTRRFRERPLRVYYDKVFVPLQDTAATQGKETSPLRIQIPTNEEERRLWQQSVPHVESGLKFAHAAHEKDSDETDCHTCHKSLPGGVINAFPTHAECIDCHEEVGDRDPQVAKATPGKPCLKCHTQENGEIIHVQRDITYVRFSHDDHQDYKCMECHFVVQGEQAYRTVLRSPALYPLPMDACYTCHQQQQATTACLDCHNQHHHHQAATLVAGGWLSKITFGYVLFSLFIMLAGASAYTYFDARLAKNWFTPPPSAPPAPSQATATPAAAPPDAAPEDSVLPFPTVDASTCIACGSCIDSCPTQVLAKDPVTHKSTVVNPDACKALEGCTICQDGCPTGAIRVTTAPLIREVERAQIDENQESNIPGLFLVGEVVGAALIKKAVNQGDQTVRYIAEKKSRLADAPYDIIVIGAGPAGLGAALQAKKLGLRYLLLERENIASTIQNYPRDKAVLAEPVPVPLYGMLPMMDAEKETLIEVWQTVVRTTGLQVNEYEEVLDLKKENGLFTVTTAKSAHQGAYVILAIGTRGNPRKLGVPGEELRKVTYNLIDAADFKGKHVLVVGGGDSAIEAAVALSKEDNTVVTLSYRRGEFSRIKSRNAQAIDEQEKAGRVTVVFNSQVTEIREQSVMLKIGEETRELENDAIFILIGADPPRAWLEKSGVKIVTVQETVGPQW